MKVTDEQIRELKGIIYLIRNTINNKVYIGQTRRTFIKRYSPVNWWNRVESPYFLHAINKYTPEKIEIEILESNKTDKELNKLEKFYINYYKSDDENYGYNLTKGGDSPKKSEESIKRARAKFGKSTKKFIKEAQSIHGQKFNYSKVEYTNNHTKVEIKCNACSLIFFQIPMSHINQKHGCPNCFCLKLRKDRQKPERFLEKAKQKHSLAYDYSLMEYINCDVNIKIICNRCNQIFQQTPYTHLKSRGCSFCFKRGFERAIYQIDILTNNIINTFESVKKAKEAMKSQNKNSYSKIHHVLNRTRTTCCGFKWRYVDE